MGIKGRKAEDSLVLLRVRECYTLDDKDDGRGRDMCFCFLSFF